MVLMWVSAIASAIVDNIPLVIAMIPMVKEMIPRFSEQLGIVDPALQHSEVAAPLLWALALGACLGGNGSLIGASANVVVAQVAKRNRYKLSFLDFTRRSFAFMVVSLIISSLYLFMRYFI
jgi:Na+/H+ antiporter NhaD/arsenite permease-like protein